MPISFPAPTVADVADVLLAAPAFGAGLALADWRAYVQSGDPSALPEAIREQLLRVRLRPLSVADRDACEAEAGPIVHLAAVVQASLRDALGEGATAADRARAADALPEDERQALHAAALRGERLARARVRRALVSIEGLDGDPWAEVQALPEAEVALVVTELRAHLDRLSVLGPEGKARAGRLLRGRPAGGGGSGGAPTASDTQQ